MFFVFFFFLWPISLVFFTLSPGVQAYFDDFEIECAALFSHYLEQ